MISSAWKRFSLFKAFWALVALLGFSHSAELDVLTVICLSCSFPFWITQTGKITVYGLFMASSICGWVIFWKRAVFVSSRVLFITYDTVFTRSVGLALLTLVWERVNVIHLKAIALRWPPSLFPMFEPWTVRSCFTCSLSCSWVIVTVFVGFYFMAVA